MTKKCIMLIDDSVHDSFFNRRVIKQIAPHDVIITMESARSALEYMRSGKRPRPDVIFLDIYMPVMDGWEFLDEYCQLDKALQSKVMIVMLATSGDPAHIEKAKNWDCISDYLIKPLTRERMVEITAKYLTAQSAA